MAKCPSCDEEGYTGRCAACGLGMPVVRRKKAPARRPRPPPPVEQGLPDWHPDRARYRDKPPPRPKRNPMPDLDVLVQDVERIGGLCFSREEIADFVDYCASALRDTPEALRARVETDWIHRARTPWTSSGGIGGCRLHLRKGRVEAESTAFTAGSHLAWVYVSNPGPYPFVEQRVEVDDLLSTGMWEPDAGSWSERFTYQGRPPWFHRSQSSPKLLRGA